MPLPEKSYYADSPQTLRDISAKIQGETEEQVTRHVHLRLFQPLTYWDILTRNRNPDSRWMKINDNERGAPSKNEYITHQNLNKEWRDVWKTFPTSIERVTFDLTIDENVDEEGRVRWVNMSVKDDDGYQIGFDDRGAGRLVAIMSTVMHMRSRGSVNMDANSSSETRAMWIRRDKIIQKALKALMMDPRRPKASSMEDAAK